MADDGFTFDDQSVKRIVKAVKYTESVSGGTGSGGRNAPTNTGASSFYARLTEEGTGSNIGRYKWRLVTSLYGSGYVAQSPDINSGDDFTARGFNGAKGLQVGSTSGIVVLLTFQGYDGSGSSAKPIYYFQEPSYSGFAVMCVDDLGHDYPYVSVKKRTLNSTAGIVEGQPFNVGVISHVSTNDEFTVVPATMPLHSGVSPTGVAYVQVSLPKQRSKGMVLQIMDDLQSPHSIDFDWLKAH